VVVENSPSLQNQNFTIVAWIKLRDGEQLSPNRHDQEVCGYGQNGYLLGIGGRGEVYLTKTGIDHTTASFRVTDSRFHHLAVTKQGAKVVFYLDGEAHPAPDYDPGFAFNTYLAVGARGDNFDGTFKGTIDELAVYNRALSAKELKEIVNSQE
jgi:Concanavalin A-like lectin/glucanases superfamily